MDTTSTKESFKIIRIRMRIRIIRIRNYKNVLSCTCYLNFTYFLDVEILWKTHSFYKHLSDLLGIRKLCVFTEFLHQEIRWYCGILFSKSSFVSNEYINGTTLELIKTSIIPNLWNILSFCKKPRDKIIVICSSNFQKV